MTNNPSPPRVVSRKFPSFTSPWSEKRRNGASQLMWQAPAAHPSNKIQKLATRGPSSAAREIIALSLTVSVALSMAGRSCARSVCRRLASRERLAARFHNNQVRIKNTAELRCGI